MKLKEKLKKKKLQIRRQLVKVRRMQKRQLLEERRSDFVVSILFLKIQENICYLDSFAILVNLKINIEKCKLKFEYI